MPFGIGPLELVLVLFIVLLIFGPKRLPGMGRSLGQGMREFKDSITGNAKEEEESDSPARLAPPASEGSDDKGEHPVQAGTSGGREDPFGRG